MVHGGLFKNALDSYKTSITKQIDEVMLELQHNLADLELKKEELEQHKQELTLKVAQLPEKCRAEDLQLPYSFYVDWNLESCLNLTGDWKNVGLLVLQGGIFALNISKNFEITVEKSLKCPVKNPLPCYYNSFLNFIDDITNLKSDVVQFVENAKEIATIMRTDYNLCIGIHHTLREKLLRHLEHNNCH